MGPRPTVTVVIPCHDHGRFVGRAVRSALRQRDADVRVVVVDDGSKDGRTPRDCDRCAGPRVRVIHQANAGLPAARNAGAAGAETEYLLFLDADDWLLPGAARMLAGAIDRARAAALDAGRPDDVSHAYGRQRHAGLYDTTWAVPDWDPLLLMVTNLHPPTALVRRDRFEAAGGFDETMRDGYEDWDFWLRCASRGWRGVRVRAPVYVWRRHSTETMIAHAGRMHETLYRRLVENHRALFDRHAEDLLVLENTMLRRFDANWIDETGYPIPLQTLWKQREDFEQLASVKFHHALHRGIGSLPSPLARAARAGLSAAKRLIPARAGPARDGPAR